MPGGGSDEDSRVVPALRAVAAVQAAHPGLLVTEAGDASEDRVGNQQIGHDFHQAELTSVPVTLLLLLLTFGALIAAGIPLLLAGTAVMTAISLLAIPASGCRSARAPRRSCCSSGWRSASTTRCSTCAGSARSGPPGPAPRRRCGPPPRTSGRAIVVSGLTVMIALAGLFLTGYSVFTGVAIGAILVVGVAVAGSVTVLPALLSWLGRWADRGRIPFLGRAPDGGESRGCGPAWPAAWCAAPGGLGVVALIGMLALAAPAVGLRLANPADGGFPASLPIVRTAEAIQRAFPGSPAPAQVVVTGPAAAPS